MFQNLSREARLLYLKPPSAVGKFNLVPTHSKISPSADTFYRYSKSVLNLDGPVTARVAVPKIVLNFWLNCSKYGPVFRVLDPLMDSGFVLALINLQASYSEN